MAAEDEPSQIECFVFFDLETTGLPKKGDMPRITELCFLALTRYELTLTTRAPRAYNKLILCFNPRKGIEPRASATSRLRPSSLEQLKPFEQQAFLIYQFLKNLPHSLCLVAHNGKRFDFPLLLAHLKEWQQLIPDDILCADSMEAFRAFDPPPKAKRQRSMPTADPKSVLCLPNGAEAGVNDRGSQQEGSEAKKSYSLSKVYARVFGQEPPLSHTAEQDCNNMLEIIYETAIDKFPQWCDANAVPLCNIRPMY
ncbi:three prime repair exonuclease [Plakobranchus ocellatus]|uniref:Three prime repair exonuclease n=1 Tax=Plakobranchus ocellatus TaxID=259542 RepID=A0AAV3YYE4_9GAST|nr:three prime repair exonuclease [Plakobranchus ocellatus]